MEPRSMHDWSVQRRTMRVSGKGMGYLSAVALCLAVGAYALMSDTPQKENALSVMSSGFEYDETLGRLQYVSNILPENAMVFLSSDVSTPVFHHPAETDTLHVWTQDEPWIEYQSNSQICACEDGEVMTIVENRENEYTVRILHSDGFESVYSGLTSLEIGENSAVTAGDRIGYASVSSAFELRKDGLSVLPVFKSSEGTL